MSWLIAIHLFVAMHARWAGWADPELSMWLNEKGRALITYFREFELWEYVSMMLNDPYA